MYTEINWPEDKKAPLIYKIEIGTLDSDEYMVYIGKAKGGVKRPVKKYWSCVRNFETNKFRKTYKDGKIVGTRQSWRDNIHIPMHKAKALGLPITLTMFNVILEDLDTIELKSINEIVNMYGDKVMNIQGK